MKFLGMTIMTTPLNHEIPMKIPMKSSWTEQKDTSKTHKKQLGRQGQWTGSRWRWLSSLSSHIRNPVTSLALPSGKRLHNYGKSPFLMGKSTINGHFQ